MKNKLLSFPGKTSPITGTAAMSLWFILTYLFKE